MKKFFYVIIVIGLVVAIASLSFSAKKDSPAANKQLTVLDKMSTSDFAETKKPTAIVAHREILDMMITSDFAETKKPTAIVAHREIQEKQAVRHITPPPDPNIILQGGDDCASATPIYDPLPYSDNGTTVGYTDDYDEACPYTGSTSPDVVYSYSPEVDTCIDLSLCNDPQTDYDTKLYVYEDECVSPYYACNDDAGAACTYNNLWSMIFQLRVYAGHIYYIVVDGCDGASGNYTLTVDYTTCPPPPANDSCQNAEAITGPYPESGTGTCIGATLDCPGVLDWNGVWYEITLPYECNNISTIICGSTEDLATAGVVLTDDCYCSNLTYWTGLDWLTDGECSSGFDGIQVWYNNIPGPGTIMWPCYAANAAGLGIDFDWEVNVTACPQPPANDSCQNAEAITGPYPTAGTGTCIGATIDCPDTLGWNGVWYTIALPYECNDITIELCGETEELFQIGAVLMDDCLCDDYILRDNIEFDPAQCPTGYGATVWWYNISGPGVIYWPALVNNDSYLGIDFSYIVDVTECPPPPANDSCENAEAIVGPYPTAGTGTCIGATIDCPGFLDWNGVWYTIALPYECNDINIVVCGEGPNDLSWIGIVLMDDCLCDDYIPRDVGFFFTCPNGYTGYDMNYYGISGPGIIYWPAWVADASEIGINFSYTVDVTECVVCEVTCPPGGIDEDEPDCYREYDDIYNGGCNSEPPVFQPISPGDTICGTSGTFLHHDPDNPNDTLNYRDTDWFQYVAVESMILSWKAVAESPVLISIIDGTLGCDSLVIISSAIGGPCDTVSLESYVEPGTYWLFIAPSVFTGWDCPVDYVAYFDVSAGCDYVPGDANGDGNVMGNDVTYSVRYFKGLGSPPPDSCPYQGDWLYSGGDANGNCAYTGSDVTFLVAYFKGYNPAILYCPETPPAGGVMLPAVIRGNNKATVPKNE